MEIRIDNGRALVTAKRDFALLQVVRQLEGRRHWLKTGELSIEATGLNLERLRSAYPSARLVESAVSAFSEVSPSQPYSPKTTPFPHQTRALEKARQQTTFALFMEQGTGKTKVAIDRAGELYCAGKISAVLVVARKGVHRQWMESQVPEHLNIGWTGHYWQGSSWKDASAQTGSGLVWRAINYDGLKTPRGKASCLEFVGAHYGRVMIIADETQDIKNARSARFKAIEQIKNASGSNYRLALTGTPIAKDLTDEWAQLKWLNESILGIRYITSFRNEYCIMGGFEGRVVVGHKNVERFRAKVDPFSFRATKDELGIAPKVYRRWKFDLSPRQLSAIKQIKKDLRMQLDSGDVSKIATAAVALTKAQQVSNGFFVDEAGEHHSLPNPRLDALSEVLAAYDGPTIVWARFRKDMAFIAERLKRDGVSFVEYHGGTSDNDRTAAVESFLSGPSRVFLSNPQAGGTGLNLQAGGCAHAVYYSNSFNAIDRWQSEDRIHRIGTRGTVVYTDLVGTGGVDAYILANLRKKKNISALALGEIAEWIEDD